MQALRHHGVYRRLGGGGGEAVGGREARHAQETRIAVMRFTHSSANSPVIDAFGGLISPPVRMIDALGRSVRSMALALLVITVTSCAVMFEMIDSAVELALMKDAVAVVHVLGNLARNRLIGADFCPEQGPFQAG